MKKIIPLLLIFSFSIFPQSFNYNFLGNWDFYGLPDYLLPERDTIGEFFTERIRSVLIPRTNLVPRHPELLEKTSINKIKLTEEADVYLSFFDETAGFTNVLGFYYYNEADVSENKGVKFNGENNYASIPFYDALNSETISFEMWVKPNDSSFPLIYKPDAFKFYVDWNHIYFKYYGTWQRIAIYDDPLYWKAWNHLVVTIEENNGNSNIKIYVNGELYADETFYMTLPQTDSDIYICGADDNGYYLKGGVDEVVFYNKVLSEEQILERYNNRKGNENLPTGINGETDVVARFQFNEENFTVTNNCTIGNGYDMTLFNEPEFIHGVFGRPPSSAQDLIDYNLVTIAFPNISGNCFGGELNPGDKIKLGHFPAGTVIGWFLYANGFSWGNIAGLFSDRRCLFSDDEFNKYDYPYDRHCIVFKDNPSGRYIVSFEDQLREWGDNDFDDAVVICTTDPVGAVDDTGIISFGEAPEEPEVDLNLQMSVDNDSPNNGDQVNYTITVTNSGPDEATNIIIKDLLPQGLNFNSSTQTTGEYNSATGEWVIPSISANSSQSLTITATVNLEGISQTAFDFGEAANYNVFVINDMYQTAADVEGKIAVGNNATFENFSIGYDIRNNPDNGYVLVSGYNLTYLIGDVYGGDVAYVHETNLPDENVGIINGDVYQDTVIDFENAYNYLLNLSNTLSSYSVNGTTEMTYTQLALTGTNPFLNVFAVDSAQINDATEVVISVPNGAVVLANIGGKIIDWNGGLVVSGTDISNVLFNFYEADTLTIHNIDVTGSILAPKTTVNFISGVQNGQMMCKNLHGEAQYNNVPFVGLIPSDSVIYNSAEIIACDQDDPDSEPNNGITNEDDFASVTISFIAESSINNTGVTWEFVGYSGNDDIIWTMARDKDGYLLSGNWGGKIYRSYDNGTSWILLNPDMGVDYIWSLAVDEEKIFVGTESGLYRSLDNGATWELSLDTLIEVRDIEIFNGTIYAATWGNGVYYSNDNGESWSSLNNDILGIPFTSITINSSGNIFLASFDSGIWRSTDAGENFEQLSIDYRFVWTVFANDEDYLFAGTYGNGVYSSIDNGETWQKDFGVTARYIYNFSVNNENDLFASSWSSGVFVALNGGKSGGEKLEWHTLGLQNMGVSSIMSGDSPEILYAATSDGKLYRTNNATLDVSGENVPTEFNLFQNYPNPFNPTTTIIFSIKKSGKVKLSVFNALGQEVAVLVNKEMHAGKYEITFDASGLASGVYLYKIQSGNFTAVKKMLLIK